jgi:hypothetical protein
MDISQLKTEIDTYCAIAGSIITDIEYARQYPNGLILNIDFEILYPFLWPRQPKSVPPYKPYGRRIFEKLLEINRAKPGFKLAFTGPSFLELLDSVVHQVDMWRAEGYVSRSNYKRIARIVEKEKEDRCLDDIRSQLIKAGVAEAKLDVLLEEHYDAVVREPIRKVRDLLGTDSVLQGLGDLIKGNAEFERAFKNAYNVMFEDMFQRRSAGELRGQRPRPEEDRRFHYAIDAANIAGSIVANAKLSEKRVYFVSNSTLVQEYCRESGRSYYTPYYWIAACLLRQVQYVHDEMDYFKSMLATAAEIRRGLMKVENEADIPGYLRETINEFYEKYPIRLKLRTAAKRSEAAVTDASEKFRELLGDQKRYERRFREAADELASEGRDLWNKGIEFMEEELLVLTDISESIVVKRIKETLSIS